MSDTLFYVLLAVFLILCTGTAVGAFLSRRTMSEDARKTIDNLNARTRSWWIMVLVFGGALLSGWTATVLLFLFLSFIALREFWTIAPSRRGDHRQLFLSFFALLPLQYWLLWTEWYGLFAIAIPVYAFLGLAAVGTLAGDTRDFLARSARVQWGLMLCVYCISHAPAIAMLDTTTDPTLLLVYLVVVVQLSDVLQYVVGKLFGRTRFSPNISPSKTLEGLLGGGALAVLVGIALTPLTPFTLLQSAGLSAAIVTAGFFGGFVLSAVKRDLAAKDWGTLIQGHGGVLDRLDSITFSAPIFFHLVRYWFTP